MITFTILYMHWHRCHDVFSALLHCVMYAAYKPPALTCAQSIRVNFCACRVVNVRNSLPDTVSFASLAAFKRFIRTVDFSELLKSSDV